MEKKRTRPKTWKSFIKETIPKERLIISQDIEEFYELFGWKKDGRKHK